MAFGPPNVQAVVLTGPGADITGSSTGPEPLIPLTPPEDRALRERADHLDIAGQNILRLLSRAAWMTEENSKNTLQEVHKLSRELRIAQDRIKELESHLSHYQHRTEHAERWLYQIAAEIERSFFKKNRHPAPMQVVTQSFVRGSQPKG
jgi:hypothetical protein